jgi:hypothetical protein
LPTQGSKKVSESLRRTCPKKASRLNIHPIAHGKTLKIDFHIGPPLQSGVGIELKMPNSQSDIQRAFGQLDEYFMSYGQNLVVVVLPNSMSETEVGMFTNRLRGKGVETIVKSKPS